MAPAVIRRRDRVAPTAAVRSGAVLASLRKHGSNPLARCCLIHRLASFIAIGRLRTVLQQKPDDGRLFVTGLLRTVAPSSSVLHGQMQRRRPRLVLLRRIRTGLDKRSDR